MSRTVSSFNPLGMTSDSMSVTKPYLYSLFAKTSIVLILLPCFGRARRSISKYNCFQLARFIHALSVCRTQARLQSLNLVQRRINALFSADKLRECDFRESVLHDLMQAENHWTDAAIARVNTNVQHARVALAVRRHFICIQDLDDFAQANLRSGTRELITAASSARGLH